MSKNTTMKIEIFFAITFIIMWSCFVVIMGVPEIFYKLGGATGLFLFLPVLFIFSLKFIAMRSVFHSILFTIVSLLPFNYFCYYFANNIIEINFIIHIYLIALPVSLVSITIFITISNFMPLSVQTDFLLVREDAKMYGRFMQFLFALLFFSLSIYIPFIVMIDGMNTFDGLQISLAGLIIGGIVFLLLTRKTSVQTFNYFAKPITRIKTDVKIVKQKYFLTLLFLLTFCTYFELYYRKLWMTWWETAAFLVIYSMILLKFGEIVFYPVSTVSDRPDVLKLPSFD